MGESKRYTKRITLNLEPELYYKIKNNARQLHMKDSQFLRFLISQSMDLILNSINVSDYWEFVNEAYRDKLQKTEPDPILML